MRTPALAIAWELRRRHRWGLAGIGAYFAALVAIRLFAIHEGRVEFETDEAFAFFVMVPMAATSLYLLAVFSFGLSGDFGARQSMYPARMFTMPVTTSALAGWPMLYGSIAMALLWLATRLIAVWPAGVDVPLLWPMLLGPAALAWTQALTWMPYPLPGLRAVVSMLWLTVIDAIVIVALEFDVSEPVMLALLAPHVPLAFLVARFAVTRARRGEVPSWHLLESGDPGRRFPTPLTHPQTWFEWRQYGLSLPIMVAIVVPLELALLFAFPDTPVIVFEILTVALLSPPFLATFVAATVGSGLTTFLATRPVTNASLIAAKLRVTMRSTLVAWAIVAVAIPLALRWSGSMPVVTDFASRLVEILGVPRAIVLALLVLAMFVVSTWKRLVQSLCIGMTGREWAIKGSVFLSLTLLAIAFPFVLWLLGNRVAIFVLLRALPEILAVFVVLKLVAAAWIAVRLRRARLLTDRTLVLGAACWCATVLAIAALLFWVLPAMLVRGYFLGMVAILFVPLTRLAAAPLAVGWSRHR
jgi:hypothetical protein